MPRPKAIKPTPAQRQELRLLELSSRGTYNVDGRVLSSLIEHGWVETFPGDTYSTRTIVAITAKGRNALSRKWR